jgi:hypothetical protein
MLRPRRSFGGPRIRFWATLRPYSRVLILWAIIAVMVAFGIWLGVDKKLIGVVVTIFGIATQAFSGLLVLMGLIPVAGPLIVKVFTLPFFWILNGLGYFLSIFAIRRGYSKEVVGYRMLTVVFLVGIVLGFILGKII